MGERRAVGPVPDDGVRVLFLCHTARPGGAELALLRMARRMTSGSVEVLFAEDGPMVEAFGRTAVPVTVLTGLGRGRGARGLGAWAALRGVVDLIRFGGPVTAWARGRSIDVVVARSVKSMIYGAVVARRLGVPLVWSVHDRISADYLGRPAALVVRFVGRVLPAAYIVNSRATGATVRTGGKPTLVAPPALDPRAGPVRSPEASPVRRVVMVGRISPWKGQDVFLRAFGRVFGGTHVEAVVVGGALFGEQDYERELHRIALAGPATGQVRFTGHVEDVRPHVAGAQVLVHASVVPEPFGLVVSEGMAEGCAVVATTPGGPAEVVTDGVDGLLVPCGDEDALVAALERLRTEPELLDALRAAAPAAIARYDVDVLLATLEPWLRAVAQGARLPQSTSAWPAGDPR